MSIVRAVAVLLLFVLVPAAARAGEEEGSRAYTRTAKFADVRDDLKDAIVNRGFIIEHEGRLSAMLERTADVVEGAKSPYRDAEYVQFCPLKLTHEAVRASPLAIANCPVSIFVYEATASPGEITIGYRLPPATTSTALAAVNAKIAALLDELAREAAKK